MVKGNDKRLNTITESLDCKYSTSVVTVSCYSCLKLGSSKVAESLNLPSKVITLKPKTEVAKLAADNIVPHMLALKVSETNAEGNTDSAANPADEADETKMS